MAPTVHLVRHAQGHHNLSFANHNLHDPLLTPLGEEQCAHLAANFPYHDKVELVVASPLKRTVSTALLSFSPSLKRTHGKVVALPEVQETSDLPCDTGSAPAALEREFEGETVEFGLVHDGWESKQGKWAPTSDAVEARAREARRWLAQRPEKEIVVVTHGGFLHYFTEDWTGGDRFHGTGWANTEFRSYRFSSHEPEKAHLTETEESRQRRRGDGKPLHKEERMNLKRTAGRDGKGNEYGYEHA